MTIPAVWFDPIKARLELDGFRPVVYEPPDLLSGDLFDNSQAVADVIDGIRAQTGEAKIDILAKCTGGLIDRHYIHPGATNIGLCNGFVGHYSFFWDPEIYLVMHTALTEPVAATTPDPAAPPTPPIPPSPRTTIRAGARPAVARPVEA